MPRISLILTLCLGVFLCRVPEALAQDTGADSSSGPDIAALLQRMSQALRSLDYEGTLVYLHENHLDALYLVHQIEHGRIHEHLVALNGPKRTLNREPDRVICELPDEHPISVDREREGTLLNAEGIDPDRLQPFYRVEWSGESRVAGRNVQVISLIPQDDLRYGYRFYLDQQTSLPLKSDLIDQTEDSIEQLMFTTLEFHPSDGTTLAIQQPSFRAAPDVSPPENWRFEQVPAGFRLVMHHEIRQPGLPEFEQFLFTDRLSSYSVYIESGAQNGLNGATRIGSVHAAGRMINGHQVTVVGEVPAKTVLTAIQGVQMRADAR